MAELYNSPDHKAFRAAFTKSDTAGEVTFTGVGDSVNQRVEGALSVDAG